MTGARWISVGCINGFLSVALGAFGAHALSSRLSEKALSVFHTANQYQMAHSLALLGLGLWATAHPQAVVSPAGWAFLWGIALFSGSLYALALTDIRILGAIAPLGGLLFLFGWIAFALSAWKA